VGIRHAQGFVAGLFVTGRTAGGPWWRIDAGLTQSRVRIGPPAGAATARLTYLEIPALVGLSGPGRPGIRVAVGGYVAALVAAHARLDAGAAPADTSLREVMRAVDAGWIFGVGADFGRVQTDLRYSGGLVNVATRPDLSGIVAGGSNAALKYRNRRFALVVSVPF
jgi:hypothetical protein